MTQYIEFIESKLRTNKRPSTSSPKVAPKKVKKSETGGNTLRYYGEMAEEFGVPSHKVLADAIGGGDKEACSFMKKMFEHLSDDNSTKEIFKKLVPSEMLDEYMESFSKPHWMQLYLKLTSRIPDRVWQCILNISQSGGKEVSKTLKKSSCIKVVTYTQVT